MRTTTDAEHWRFSFTISDTARFIGKSPVTLRSWERKGDIKYPRRPGKTDADRVFTAADVRTVAQRAFKLGRITRERLRLVEASLTIIEFIEKANIK